MWCCIYSRFSDFVAAEEQVDLVCFCHPYEIYELSLVQRILFHVQSDIPRPKRDIWFYTPWIYTSAHQGDKSTHKHQNMDEA